MGAEGARAARYMAYAEELAETCYQARHDRHKTMGTNTHTCTFAHTCADIAIIPSFPPAPAPQMYAQQASGLAPDAVRFAAAPSADAGAHDMSTSDAHWQLRPETVESLFYLWRATGDAVYRQRGWEIFSAVEARCRVLSGGYAGLKDTTAAFRGGWNPRADVAPGVSREESNLDGTQPSWFLAETLKYFFLLFSDSETFNLNEWVLNTEAHPLRVAPHAALRASLLQGLRPEELLRGGGPLPRGMMQGVQGGNHGNDEGGFGNDDAAAHIDAPEGAQEAEEGEAWVAAGWEAALRGRRLEHGWPK
jgi:hypothetical protein